MNIWYKGTKVDIGLDYQTEKMYDAIKTHLPQVMEAEKTIGKGLIYSSDVEGRVSFASSIHNCQPYDTRIVTKLGKYITKHLQITDIDDNTLAKAVETIMASVKFHIEIVEGETITQAYAEAYGNGSCMSGEDNESKLAMYKENPEQIKICLYKSGSQKARALLWLLGEDEIFIDRIYDNTRNPAHIRKLFTEHVKEKYPNRKLLTRSNESSDHKSLQDGAVRQVTLKKPSTGRYPYADTFAVVMSKKGDQITVSTGSLDDLDGHLGRMWSTHGDMYS